MTTIGPVAQQGVISTQVEHVVVDAPAPAKETASAPLAPAVETGRGGSLDTSA